MKLFLMITLLLATALFADDKARLYKLYNKGSYEKVCNQGFKLFRKNRYDEAFISLYAYSCLNSDYLDRLATPIVMLKYSKDARANAAYLASILMKKKLLYHALLDGYDVSGVVLPASSYILSKVFDLFTKNRTKPSDGIYALNDPADPKTSYQLYLDRSEKVAKIVIEEYYNNILKQRHIYW